MVAYISVKKTCEIKLDSNLSVADNITQKTTSRKMTVRCRLAILCLLYSVAMVTGDVEYRHMEDWAVHEFEGEPTEFRCSEALNLTTTEYVEWETPVDGLMLRQGEKTTYFEVAEDNGVSGGKLLVLKIEEKLHGIYTCRVFDTNDAMIAKTIFGLNLYEAKYRHAMDKYRKNFTVGLISAGIFFVCLVSPCIVYSLAWERRNPGKYVPNDTVEMTSQKNGGVAETVASGEGQGAYENAGFSTPM